MTGEGDALRVAVVGAGIVGVCCALHLQHARHEPTVIDPCAPGTLTSFGNAGGIVTGSVVPNSTSLRRNLLRILSDGDSPVRLRWSYLPKIAPWLLRFLREGSDARVRRIARALHPLVSRAYAAHRELIALSGADGIVKPVGWLKVFQTEAGFAATAYDREIMAANNVRIDVITADEIHQLDPALARRFVKGLLQPASPFVSSPYKLTGAFVAHFIRLGGHVLLDTGRGYHVTSPRHKWRGFSASRLGVPASSPCLAQRAPQADPEPASSGVEVADTIEVGFTAVGSACRVLAVRQKRSKTLDLSVNDPCA